MSYYVLLYSYIYIRWHDNIFVPPRWKSTEVLLFYMIRMYVYVMYYHICQFVTLSDSIICLSQPISCHHFFVSLSSFSNLSSSCNNNILWGSRNVLSLKSLRRWIVDQPELQESATYKLKRLSPPDGGLAMSMITYGMIWPSAVIGNCVRHVEIRASSPLFYEYFSHILPYFTFIFD